MNEYCENLISNGVPSWIVEEAYKFTIEPLKSTEGLVGKLIRKIVSYIEMSLSQPILRVLVLHW